MRQPKDYPELPDFEDPAECGLCVVGAVIILILSGASVIAGICWAVNG